MTTQPEQILENNLVAQLAGMAYEAVAVHDEASLLANLKTQIEAHNGVVLSAGDFRQILNKLNKGSIFEKARTLRDRVAYTNDNGETKTVELLDQIDWCKNRFQVTQQVTVEGRYKNRYDVTILMNGLPLVVNMFLTGFDSEKLNTLYADKNLKYHGLIQAFSRTNRTCGELKSQGNIVSFRNLKAATDQAIELFANKNASEEIILNPYDDYVKEFNEAFAAFWEEEQQIAFNRLAEEEGLMTDRLEKLVGDYLFTGKKPLRNEVVEAMGKKPGLRDRASTAERIIEKIYRFIETFINDL